MPEEEFFDLMTKYDLKENGTFAYVEFLRHFILSLKPKEETNLMSRRKLPPTRASVRYFLHSNRDDIYFLEII